MNSAKGNLGLLISLGLIVLFTNLGGPKLWDRDEPRNAGCALEMMAAGDWVVPRFNDELRTHKPVMLYWLMITAYSLFGVSEFSARFFSAVLGLLTILLTYDLGRRLFDTRVGLWAAICLATTIMFTVAARAATPDAPLIFFVTLGIWVFVYFSFPKPGEALEDNPRFYPANWWQVGCVYGALGLAVLSKGPVGLVLPTAILGMFLLIMRLPASEPVSTWRGRIAQLASPFFPLHFLKTVWFMRPLLAIAACGLVALPWYVWVAARDFRWIEGFFFEHNLDRAVTAFEGHSGPPYYYLIAICIGFFPWSVFFTPLLIDLGHQLKHTDAKTKATLILCSCWVGVWLVAFSIAQTKLPSYITPLYPGLALLLGMFVVRVLERKVEFATGWFHLAFGLTAVVGVAMTVGLFAAAGIFLPGEQPIALVGVVLVIGGGATWYWIAQGDRVKAFRGFSMMATLLMVGLFAFAAQRVSNHQSIDQLLAKIDQASPDATLCSYGVSEASWVFYARQPIKFVAVEANALEEELARNKNPILLTTPEKLEQLPSEMRDQLVEVAREPYFLKDYPLIALRPTPEYLEMAAIHAASRR